MRSTDVRSCGRLRRALFTATVVCILLGLAGFTALACGGDGRPGDDTASGNEGSAGTFSLSDGGVTVALLVDPYPPRPMRQATFTITLTDAGGKPISALPGAATFDSAMSFGLIRGGHVDVTVLGGLQVDARGRLANWMIPGKMVPGMGGAMDLVSGAKRVIIAMQHAAKGKSKIVAECNLPLTSVRPVDLVVTDMAVIGFPNGRATLQETAPGVGIAEVLAVTEAELVIPDDVPEMRF